MNRTSTRGRAAWAVGYALAGAMILAACSGSGSSGTASSGGRTSAVGANAAVPATPQTVTAPGATAVTKVSFTGPAPSALAAQQISAAKATLDHAGTLSVCTSLPSPSFEVADANGHVVGLDMDYMQMVASELGASMKVVDTPFSAIASGQGLASKRCDINAAGMSITPERRAIMQFSEPYFDTNQGVIVLAKSTVSSLQSLKGKRIAVQSNTTGAGIMAGLQSACGCTLVQFEDIPSETQALQSGQVAAAVNDEVAFAPLLKQASSPFREAVVIRTGIQMGYAASKGNTALIAVVNYVLNKAKSDGDFTKIYTKWIGKAPTGA